MIERKDQLQNAAVQRNPAEMEDEGTMKRWLQLAANWKGGCMNRWSRWPQQPWMSAENMTTERALETDPLWRPHQHNSLQHRSSAKITRTRRDLCKATSTSLPSTYAIVLCSILKLNDISPQSNFWCSWIIITLYLFGQRKTGPQLCLVSPRVFSSFCHLMEFGFLSLSPLACLVGHLLFNNIDLTALTLLDENSTELDYDVTVFCRTAL